MALLVRVELRVQRLFGLSDFESVDLHGQLDPEVEAWVAAHPTARAHSPLRP